MKYSWPSLSDVHDQGGLSILTIFIAGFGEIEPTGSIQNEVNQDSHCSSFVNVQLFTGILEIMEEAEQLYMFCFAKGLALGGRGLYTPVKLSYLSDLLKGDFLSHIELTVRSIGDNLLERFFQSLQGSQFWDSGS